MLASRSGEYVDTEKLRQTVNLLATLNKDTVIVPNDQQIDALSHSAVAPFLNVLCDHVVGPHEAILVRRHLYELQQSNLPKSILSELFSEDILRPLKEKGSGPNRTLETLKEKTSVLEKECDGSEAELSRLVRNFNAVQKEHKAQQRLNQLSNRNATLLSRYVEQVEKIRAVRKTENLDDIRQMLPVVMSQIEGLQRDEDSRIEPSLPEGSTYPSWKALLTETVVSLSDDTEVDDQSIVSEPSNEFSNRLAELRDVLIEVKRGMSRVPDDTLDQRIDDAVGLGGCPGRDQILSLARARARQKILDRLKRQGKQVPVDLEQQITRTRDLHKQTSSRLKIVQSLLQKTRELALKLPEEVENELSPLQEDIRAKAEDLKGSIDSCRCDIEASTKHGSVSFSDEVCGVLGLPIGSSGDGIYEHVQKLVQSTVDIDAGSSL